MNTLTSGDDDSPSDMILAWSHPTSEALHTGSFPAHDTQVVSRYAAHYKLKEPPAQMTPMSCPACSTSTYQMSLAHDNYVVSCSVNQLKTFSVAHDLMSCPTERNTASSSSKQSVRIQKSHTSNNEKYPKNPPFRRFLTQSNPENASYTRK